MFQPYAFQAMLVLGEGGYWGGRGGPGLFGLGRKYLQLSSRYGLSEPQNIPDRNTGSGSDVVPYTITKKVCMASRGIDHVIPKQNDEKTRSGASEVS